MTLQTKLKFNVRPDQLSRLRSLPLFRKISTGRAKTRSLSTTYFDTRRGDLRGMGVSLRVRRDDGNYLQTLKATAEAVGNARVGYAFESTVSSERPAISLISPPSLRRRIQDVGAEQLKPLIRVDVNRTDRTVSVGEGHQALLEIEEGEIQAGGKSITVADVELSASEIPLHQLYELALNVHEKVALYPVAESESEIGYRHLGLTARTDPDGRSSPMRKRKKIEKVFSGVLQGCFEKLQESATRLHEGADISLASGDLATLVRLKTALRVFHHLMPEEQCEELLAEIEGFTELFRAWDGWETFDKRLVGPARRRLGGDLDLEPLHDIVEQYRRSARSWTRDALMSERFSGVLLTLGYWLALGPWREIGGFPKSAAPTDPITPFARDVLSRKAQDIGKMAKRAAKTGDNLNRELAGEILDLGDMIVLFADLYPAKKIELITMQIERVKARKDFLDALDNAWANLGKMEASTDASAGPGAFTAGVVLGWHTRSKKTAERKLDQHVEAVLAAKYPWSRNQV